MYGVGDKGCMYVDSSRFDLNASGAEAGIKGREKHGARRIHYVIVHRKAGGVRNLPPVNPPHLLRCLIKTNETGKFKIQY